MSLFVGNLSPHVQHWELENAFRRFGRSNLELKDGFGFVVYEEHRDAERALRALQGRLVCGERLSISWARKHRPFQRFSGKGNSFRRGSWDKDQGQIGGKRPSVEPDKGSDDDVKDQKVSTEVKDGARVGETRDDAVKNFTVVGEEDWKDQGTEKQAFEEETKVEDPLDSGRWGEPLSEGSLEHMAIDDMRDYEEDVPDGKGKEDIEGNAQEKSHGSPADKSLEHSSRVFRNSDDQYKRGRDALGKPQERCFNCGHLGHVMRQCRLRLKMNMYHRDGFDGRRNQYRNLRGIGFRGMGGRFRGMDGPRRGFNRDTEGTNGRRNVRRRGSIGDRRLYEQGDTKSCDKSRRRNRRSDSPRDSASRQGSKRKLRKLSKKSSRSTRKRQRSSSDSVSASRSHSRSSSSSRSRSRSHTSASKSESKSQSQSSSSMSRSRKSRSESSRSRSASASSRSPSRSGTSHSRKSLSKSQSRSSKSRSRSHSPPHARSPDSRRSLSLSPAPVKADSPFSQHNYPEHSTSPKFSSLRSEEFEGAGVAATYTSATGSERQEKQDMNAAERHEKNGSQYSSEDWDMNEPYMNRQERRWYESKESKSWKDRTRTDVKELYDETEKLSNGGNRNLENIKASTVEASMNHESDMNKHFSRDYKQHDQNTALVLGRLATERVSCKGLEFESASLPAAVVRDSTLSAYMPVLKEHHRGDEHAGHGQGLMPQSFGAARLWPWEMMLCRRLKRGPISTSNYERRKLQNEEFGIDDKFVRSSSGWWEKRSE